MEAMALHQESAFERLYRWTQSKLPLDFIAKISNELELIDIHRIYIYMYMYLFRRHEITCIIYMYLNYFMTVWLVVLEGNYFTTLCLLFYIFLESHDK